MYSNYFLISGKDYVVGSSKVKFLAKVTTVSFNVCIKGDEILESNETFQLGIKFKKLPNGMSSLVIQDWLVTRVE